MDSLLDQQMTEERMNGASDPLGTSTGERTFEQVKGIPPEMCGPLRFDHPLAAKIQVLDGKTPHLHFTEGKKRSKVCIVGYAETSRHLAWFDDPDCEIWGVNQLNRFIPRADRWFQIHRDWNTPEKWAEGTDQAKWLASCEIPVYMIDVCPNVPNSVKYPVDWVKQTLGLQVLDPGTNLIAKDANGKALDHDYFTSSIAFMYALAIAEGFTEIGIYGIDLIIGREYFFEKSCVEFYMGIAHARGIGIHRPDACALLWQSHRYGYEAAPDYGFFSLDRLGARMKQLRDQAAVVRDECHVMQGRVNEIADLIPMTTGEAQGHMEVRLRETQEKLNTKMNQLYQVDGAKQELERMHAILEIKSRGGQVSA